LLENIKLYLGITGTAKDDFLVLLIDTCTEEACIYTGLNNNSLTQQKLSHIITMMVIERYNKRGNEGISSATYDGVSESYFEDYSAGIYRQLQQYKKLKVI